MATAPIRKMRTIASLPKSEEMDQLRASILKRFGNKMLVQADSIKQPGRIPLGIFTFDYATCGGIPHNRVTMFHGKKHSGKSSAALRAVAGAQRTLPSQQAAFVDVEGTLDEVWATKLGVDTSTLVVAQPAAGEHAVDVTEGLIRTRDVSIVVIDSIAALVPMKEIEDSAEDAHVGLQSRLVGVMLRKVNAALIDERNRGHLVTILLINQQRTAIGKWAPHGQTAISLPGGQALGFMTSLEAQWKNKENISKDADGSETLSFNEHAFTIEKNKLNGGIRTGEFRMLRRDDDELGLGEGAVDDAGTVLTFAKRIGWLTGGGRAGSTLEFQDVKQKFAKIDDAIAYLYENYNIYWQLRTALIIENAKRMGMRQDFIDYLGS